MVMKSKLRMPIKVKIITNKVSLDELLHIVPKRLENYWQPFISTVPSRELRTAMHYTCSNGGKRIRPLLTYATSNIFDNDWQQSDSAAAAIELMHTFSLIHDDLPCMDNADLRRGKASCHKKFNEAIAVLTGDALQSLAFQIISTDPSLKPDRKIQMIHILAKATGPYGMTAGQALDITLLNDPKLPVDVLQDIYRLKTGQLIAASIELGRLSSTDDDERNQKALSAFGELIGLAFQLQDDILDMTTSTTTLGKNQNSDIVNNKFTLANKIGLVAAKQQVADLYKNALEAINYLGTSAQLLRELTAHLLLRNA